MAPEARQSFRREGALPRLWIDSSLASRRSISPSSTNSSARPGGVAASFPATPPTGEVFYARGLYDFESPDPAQLSFKADDLLEIVKIQDNGWWAAARPDGSQVGWIPSSFVEPLPEGQGGVAWRAGGVSQAFKDEDELLAPSPLIAKSNQTRNLPMLGGDHVHDWEPLSAGDNVPDISIFLDPRPRDTAAYSPLLPPEEVDHHFADDDAVSPIEKSLAQFRFHPRSSGDDTSPVEQSKPYGLRQARKPMVRKRSVSVPMVEAKPFEYQKGRSESISSYEHRQLRRRPLIIDDRSSLNRLTTLFETQSLEEVEILMNSPVTPEGLEVLKPSGLGISQRLDQTSADDTRHCLQTVRSKTLAGELHYALYELRTQPDGRVMAGTLQALVERLTADLERSPQELKFRHIFLMSFRTFATADEVFSLLLERYDMPHPSTMSSRELNHWMEKYLEPKQMRILNVFKIWVEEHGLIQDEPHISLQIAPFLSSIISPPALATEAASLLISVERPASTLPLALKRKKSKGIKLEDFFAMKPDMVAKQICLLDHSLYAKIRPRECLAWAKSGEGTSVTHLSTFIATYNKIAAWVKQGILYQETPVKRAQVIDFWIEVAQACLTMRNFSTTNALVSALCSPALNCLKLTWQQVTKTSHFNFLHKLEDPSCNFAAQRQFELAASGPSVPFVLMYLKDIIRINEECADTVPVADTSTLVNAPLINFLKREKYYDVVTTMLRHQQVKYTFTEDPPLMAFLEESLAEAKEDEEFFVTRSREVRQVEAKHAYVRKGLELAGP